MIHKKYIETEKLKEIHKKLCKNEMKIKTKDMTQEQKEDYKKINKENKIKVQMDKKLEYALKHKEQIKLETKNMSQEEKNNYKKNKIHKQSEFLYIDELDGNYTKLNKYVCVDPGKKCLLYMKDKNGNKFRYSNKMHIKRSKRLKYQKILQNYKDKNNISKLESELSNYNSKSCNLEKFKEYIFYKNKLNKVLLEKYKETIFRKLKWFAYIDRQKTENKLVNDIKKNWSKYIGFW